MKRALLFLASLVALVGLLSAPMAVAAPDFNVGDRVEIDLYCNGNWSPGVVIDESAEAYLVRVDPVRPGMPMGEYTIPKTGSYVDCIRASNKPLPPDQQVDKRQPTGILDCPITQGISGKKLSVATAKKMVRCLMEFYDGDDYASRVDIKSFKPGRPRPWSSSDIGAGTPSTLVYPIKVEAIQLSWTSKSVEERRWLRIYNCFYTTLDEWTCGLGERIKDWPSITRPRA